MTVFQFETKVVIWNFTVDIFDGKRLAAFHDSLKFDGIICSNKFL